jgi:hypothetical protein
VADSRCFASCRTTVAAMKTTSSTTSATAVGRRKAGPAIDDI